MKCAVCEQVTPRHKTTYFLMVPNEDGTRTAKEVCELCFMKLKIRMMENREKTPKGLTHML